MGGVGGPCPRNLNFVVSIVLQTAQFRGREYQDYNHAIFPAVAKGGQSCSVIGAHGQTNTRPAGKGKAAPANTQR